MRLTCSIGSNTPINQIQFVYAPRQRPEQSYVAGQSILMNTILSEIKTIGNGVGFRSYVLESEQTSLGYQRLKSITEKSGDNLKSYNPTVFSYDTTNNANLFNIQDPTIISLSEIDYNNTGKISGDFDGDGKTDFLLYPTKGADSKAKYWLFSEINSQTSLNIGWEHPVGKFDEIFPVSWLSWNNKLMPMQGWTVIKGLSTDATTFTTYCVGSTSPIYYQYEKAYNFPKFTYYNDYNCGNTNSMQKQASKAASRMIIPIDDNEPPAPTPIELTIPKSYVSGDFNGDGLTDAVVIEKPISYSYQSGCYGYSTTRAGGQAYFVNLDRRLTANFVNQAGYITSSATSEFEVADFNGDGKADIFVFDTGYIKVYTLNDANYFVLLYQNTTSDASIVLDKPFLMGDYNGDGKADFVMPTAVDQDSWNFYLSTATSFNKFTSSIGVKFKQFEYGFYGVMGWDPLYTYSLNENSFIANDYNGDGKTDILYQQNLTVERIGNDYSSRGTSQITKLILLENKSITGNAINFSVATTPAKFSGVKRAPIPIFTNHNKINQSLEYSVISNNVIHSFKGSIDTREDVAHIKKLGRSSKFV